MKALLLVDIQNDFLAGGALPVADGDQVAPVANRLMPAYDLVIATQDWHPADHLSFASQHDNCSIGQVIDLDGLPQILWPDHCIQAAPGASFASALDIGPIRHVVRKGTDRRIDSYSGFFDNGHRKATGLDQLLRDHAVTDLHVMGLATDYCVKATVLDARRLAIPTTVLLEGCRGVNLHPGDIDAAVRAMRDAGAVIA